MENIPWKQTYAQWMSRQRISNDIHANTGRRSHKFYTRTTTTGGAFDDLRAKLGCHQPVKYSLTLLQEKPPFHVVQDFLSEYLKIF